MKIAETGTGSAAASALTTNYVPDMMDVVQTTKHTACLTF
jgi:hypothetical protein|tara:strand:- start:49 stop:168 length:120 start_codon:yes stop_codon:yes gene_type:complete